MRLYIRLGYCAALICQPLIIPAFHIRSLAKIKNHTLVPCEGINELPALKECKTFLEWLIATFPKYSLAFGSPIIIIIIIIYHF